MELPIVGQHCFQLEFTWPTGKRTRYIEIICDRKVLRNCLDLLTY